MGVIYTEFDDGYEYWWNNEKATINSHGDHRIAMSFAIAGLNCDMEYWRYSMYWNIFPKF